MTCQSLLLFCYVYVYWRLAVSRWSISHVKLLIQCTHNINIHGYIQTKKKKINIHSTTEIHLYVFVHSRFNNFITSPFKTVHYKWELSFRYTLECHNVHTEINDMHHMRVREWLRWFIKVWLSRVWSSLEATPRMNCYMVKWYFMSRNRITYELSVVVFYIEQNCCTSMFIPLFKMDRKYALGICFKVSSKQSRLFLCRPVHYISCLLWS